MTMLLRRRGVAAKRRVLASDDFSEANGTAMQGKALDVGGVWAWIANAGNTFTGFTVQGGVPTPAISGNDPDNFLECYTDVGATDVAVSAVLTPGSTASCYLIARSTDVASASNFYHFAAHNSGWDLYKLVAGVNTQLATSASGGGAGTYELRCVGNSIKVFKNGSEIASVTDSSLSTGTKFGFGYYSGSSFAGASVDNWSAVAA